MEAKEKAEELFYNMYNTEHCGIKHFPNKHYCNCSEINYFQAIECALVAVDEIKKYLSIIEENETADHAFGGDYNGDEYYDYWKEVKKEIEKLK